MTSTIDSVQKSELNSYIKLFLSKRTEDEITSDQLYTKYPQLFSSAFTNVKEQEVDTLNIAGFLYYKSVLLLDSLIDDKSTQTKIELLFLSNKLQEESIKLLTSIFGLNTTFWNLWGKRQQEYFRAIQLEKQLALKPTFKKYQEVADLKAAFGKVAIDCLYVLSKEKDQEKYDDLLQSHFHFSVGLQLIDDLQDLDEDLKNEQFNWVYYQTISTLEKNRLNTKDIDLVEIKKLIYIKGIAISIRKKALKEFETSKKSAQKHQVKEWITIIEKKEREIKEAIDNIEGCLQLTAVKIELQQKSIRKISKVKFSCKNRQVEKGVNFLINEWRKDYPELKHLMYLSNLDGFSGKSRIHLGDIFQRAMVTNVFCKLQKELKTDFNIIIQQEVNYLIANRLKTRTGGWSYYPSCPEIAADIDDLGEIMQVLNASNNIDLIDKFCDNAIKTTLTKRTLKNNGIETWIIPKENLTKKEERQIYFNTTKWGVGLDNEVMANFLYGLAIYNKAQYKEQILKSCQFLFKNQSKDGFWESRWYYGNYYGTYVCLRLFAEMKIQNEQLKTTAEYIKNQQNKDGGWGLENTSDPLNTAFALLCVKTLNLKIPNSAIEYLYQQQLSDGNWKGISFIKPRTNDPYISSTLTTAIVLKALATVLNH